MRKLTIVLGFALFAMFFGAGNLIFPPTLGRAAGSDFLPAMLGFVLTGVGLPLLGIIAVAKSEGGIDHIARRINPLFAMMISIVIMLAIGPLLAIPRTCATTYELGIMPLFPWLDSWTFSFLFFGAVLFFALNPLSVIDRIGKILTPLLLSALLTIIVVGVIHPLGSVISVDATHSFGKGFVEGYQTMDLMGSVIFGIIILNEVRSKGVFEKSQQLKVIIVAGCISAIGLVLVYGGLVYLGATAAGIGKAFTRTELVAFITNTLLGQWGGVALALAVSMACLTTAIGLTVMCGEYFNKISRGRLNYKMICIVVAAISLVFSNAGVEKIIKLAVPPLVSLYPVVMVVVFLSLVSEKVENRNVWRGAVIGAFMVGLIEALKAVGITIVWAELLYDLLPLTKQGLGWVVPSIALGLIGGLIRERPLPVYRVLAVSPSSTGTLVAVFDNDIALFEKFIPHPSEVFAAAEPMTQGAIIMGEVLDVMREHRLDLSRLDAVAGRCGFTKPLPSGVYRISDRMLEDLEKGTYGIHASNWGAFVARKLGESMNVPAFVVDPVVVDEMSMLARVTGLPEINRRSVFHVSTHKAVIRRAAKNLWKRPSKVNIIVAHLGDGISVAAHKRGRAIDVNNALDGDGPFSVITAGTIPTGDLVRLCYSGKHSEDEMLTKVRDKGGIRAHLGTSSFEQIMKLIDEGDEKAQLVLEAMAYQVAKAVGACASALRGRVDAIAFSGKFVASKKLMQWIRDRVCFIAPVFVYPDENEALSITKGVLHVLHGEAEAREYA